MNILYATTTQVTEQTSTIELPFRWELNGEFIEEGTAEIPFAQLYTDHRRDLYVSAAIPVAPNFLKIKLNRTLNLLDDSAYPNASGTLFAGVSIIVVDSRPTIV